jgi:hypothetical protein
VTLLLALVLGLQSGRGTASIAAALRSADAGRRILQLDLALERYDPEAVRVPAFVAPLSLRRPSSDGALRQIVVGRAKPLDRAVDFTALAFKVTDLVDDLLQLQPLL